MSTSARAFALWGMLVPVWCVLTVPDAQAQSQQLTAQELTGRADVVAVGKVSEMKSEWNADRTRIVTRARITVREVLKGSASERELSILTAGGEVGDVGELYTGSARFEAGEDVVVFAKALPGREMGVVGGARGKFTLERSAATGMMMAGRWMPLDDLRSQVRAIIQAPAPEGVRP